MEAARQRVRCAWAKFRSSKPILMCRKLSMRLKLRVLESIVRPTLLWGSHTWTWNHSMATLVRRTHRTMIERMMRIYKKPSESWDEFWMRRGILLNAIMHNMHHACWLLSAMILQHRWAGHCVMMNDRAWAKRTGLQQPAAKTSQMGNLRRGLF